MKAAGIALCEFCDIRLGKMLDRKRLTGRNLRPYLRNVNVQWGHIDTSDLLEMDFDEPERELFRLQRGDLLVCEGGEVGRAAIWNNEIHECYYQKALHRIRPDQCVCSPEYLLCYFKWLSDSGNFVKYTSHSTITHLTSAKLKTVRIYLPSLPKQRLIVETLSRAEGIRRLQRDAQQKGRQLILALFAEMFGDPDINPRGWPEVPFGDLITYSKYGPRFPKRPYSDSGAHILRTTDIAPDGSMRWWEAPKIAVSAEEVRKHALKPRTLLVTRSGTIGRLAVFMGADHPCIAGAYLLEFGLRETVHEEFIQAFFLSTAGQQRLLIGSRSMTLANLNAPSMKSLFVPLPPLSLQNAFASRVAKLRSFNRQRSAAIAATDQLAASLMLRLFDSRQTLNSI